jgi:hypothetical protein
MISPFYAYGQSQIAALPPAVGPTTTSMPATIMPIAQCIDFNSDGVCEYVVLANGTMITNPLLYGQQGQLVQQQPVNTNPMSQLVERQKVIIKEHQRDNDDDDNDNDSGKTYCDVPNPSNPCHDRRDGDEITGLYTCMDGSHEEDWRDCNGNSNDDDDNNDEEREDDEETANCGGEPCTPTEKEDSWTDEEEEESNDEEDSNDEEAAADENVGGEETFG